MSGSADIRLSVTRAQETFAEIGVRVRECRNDLADARQELNDVWTATSRKEARDCLDALTQARKHLRGIAGHLRIAAERGDDYLTGI